MPKPNHQGTMIFGVMKVEENGCLGSCYMPLTLILVPILNQNFPLLEKYNSLRFQIIIILLNS
jgi:hypothetical protein